MAAKAASMGKKQQFSFWIKFQPQLIGLLSLIVAAFVSVSLYSYHAADPSFNVTGDGHVRNAAGALGSVLADILVQSFGAVAWVVPFSFMGWSWRLLLNDAPKRAMLWRVVALMAALCSISTVVAVLAAGSESARLQNATGAIGIVVGLWLVPVIGSFGAVLFSAIVSLLTLPLALGVRFHEWVTAFIVSKVLLMEAWRALSRVTELVKRPVLEQVERHVHVRAERAELQGREPKIDKKFRSVGIVMQGADETDNDAALNEGGDVPVVPVSRVERKQKVKKEQASLELRTRSGDYTIPSVDLLQKISAKRARSVSESALEQNARLLESVLLDFGVKGDIIKVRPGPVVTLYELEPAPGIKSSRVIGLADDIARSMSAISARIAVIPGRNAIGIELPNASRETVYMRELIEDESYEECEHSLPLILGKDIGGEPIIADLARMPHLLVAGTTGSGKSVAINTMLMSLIYTLTPEQCKLILIDPKMLELSVYDDIPHLLSPVVTEPGKAVVALKWAVKEMENRYRLMSNLGVRNISNYNKRLAEARAKGEELTRTVQTGFDPETGKPIMEKQPLDMSPLPFIVVVVDEMADLMLVAGKDIEGSIQRLAQMARAAGIHLIMATQRPSVDVITGVIKANFPTRISFQVTSKIDSRTILGEQGAEQLLGQGDMLYMAGGGRVSRVHGPFISDKEVENIVTYLRTQGEPAYEEAVTRDDEESGEFGGAEAMEEESDADRALYQQAVEAVVRDGKASTSYIQRRLKIGYNRAARLIEKMEAEGIVGPANHVGKREVLMR